MMWFETLVLFKLFWYLRGLLIDGFKMSYSTGISLRIFAYVLCISVISMLVAINIILNTNLFGNAAFSNFVIGLRKAAFRHGTDAALSRLKAHFSLRFVCFEFMSSCLYCLPSPLLYYPHKKGEISSRRRFKFWYKLLKLGETAVFLCFNSHTVCV